MLNIYVYIIGNLAVLHFHDRPVQGRITKRIEKSPALRGIETHDL